MIIVLGSSGLLGSTICRLYPADTMGFDRRDFDVRQIADVRKVITDNMPDAVINCAGVVPNNSRQDTMHYVNAEFPHLLEEICTKLDVRLVHVSTDCVFNGINGFDRAETYNEHCGVNATTEYGRSKAEGEFIRMPHLVVRTSFVGLPDMAGRSLLAWLYRSRGQIVDGWTNVLWNGWTVDQVADILYDLAYRRSIWGLYHLCGETISKYTLLRIINHLYGFDCTIRPTEHPVRRSMVLSTVYPEIERLYPLQCAKSFKVMALWMKERLGDVNL